MKKIFYCFIFLMTLTACKSPEPDTFSVDIQWTQTSDSTVLITVINESSGDISLHQSPTFNLAVETGENSQSIAIIGTTPLEENLVLAPFETYDLILDIEKALEGPQPNHDLYVNSPTETITGGTVIFTFRLGTEFHQQGVSFDLH